METHVWVTDLRTGHQYPTPIIYADSLPDDLKQDPGHEVRDETGRLLDPILNTDPTPGPDTEPATANEPYIGYANPQED